MTVLPETLEGDKKTVEINFELEDKKKIADLKIFTLKASITHEVGDIGSKISYNGLPKGTTDINASLKDVSRKDFLNAANPACTVEINILPAPKTTELELTIRVVNGAGTEVGSKKVTWKAVPKQAEVSLTKIDSEKIKGTERTTNIEIENKGLEATEKDQLKLLINAQAGNSASIIGAKQVGNTTRYMLDLPQVAPTGKISHPITIDPKDENRANFKLQLQYKGQNIGDPFNFTWERGAELKVTEAKYNPETGKVTATVKNIGTETATSGKITTEINATKTPGAKIEGNNIVQVQSLKPGEEQKIDDLGTVEFGNKETAVCKFGTSCAQSCPKAPKPIVEKVLIKTDIVLSLTPSFDVDKKEVTVVVRNGGKDTAKGLKLTYENTSSDQAGKFATLDTKQTGVRNLGDLEGTKDYKHIFKLDFKDADEADFNFKLIYDDTTIDDDGISKTFKDKPLNLSLEIVVPAIDNSSNYILYGAQNELKLRINQEANSRHIQLKDLTLAIQPEGNNGGTVSKDPTGPGINKIGGAALGNDLGEDIKLYVHSASGTTKAAFKFQLKYKDKNIAEPVLVEWREYPVTIDTPVRLVGSQEGSFQIVSLVPLDPSAITVTLEGDHGTTFQFYKANGDVAGNVVALSEVAEYNRNRSKTYDRSEAILEPIKFKINQKNGQQAAKLTIIVKRGNTEIARKGVDWVEKGIGLSVSLERPTSYDIQKLGIAVKNTTNQSVHLNEVKVNLTNTENVSFSLGSFSGSIIEKNLADVIGENKLDGETGTYTQLLINSPLGDRIATGLTLQLLDNEGKVIDQVYFLYFRRSFVIEEEFKRMIEDNKEEFLSKLEKIKNNLNALMYLQTTLKKVITWYSQLSTKLLNIKEADTSFEPLVNTRVLLYADMIKKWEDFEHATQTAISEFDKDEKVIVAWYDNLLIEVSEIQKKINRGSEDVKKIDKIADNIDFLMGDYNSKEQVDKQSIQALYKYYNSKIEEIKAFLLNRGITNFDLATNDAEFIKKLKTTYKRMVEELPSLKLKVQEIFEAGFETFNKVLVKQQEDDLVSMKALKKIGKEDEQDYITGIYNSLVVQKNGLRRWKRLADYEKDLVPHGETIQDMLAEDYQKLAEINRKFAKIVGSKSTRNSHGNFTNVAELTLEIATDAFKIAQTRKNQQNQEAAIKVYKAAIKTWEAYEHKRGAQVSRAKLPQLSRDESGEFILIPTTLKNLNTNLKSLRIDYKEGRYKKKNIFGMDAFRKNRKQD
ncbi:MAG: hypothetical protein BGO68_03440 [Candidatus Amoebophilus sp. 36-38]|nr:MAG: hypothetical protein BGO68_03440 [Candidatus Amoebophilus sp. 36-38]